MAQQFDFTGAKNPFQHDFTGAVNPFAQTPEQPKGRTWGEAASDSGVSLASGFAALGKNIGDLYGLGTGDMDNWLSERGKRGIEYWNSKKSEPLRLAEQDRNTKIEQAQGIANKAGVAFWETLKNPALMSSFFFEQAPQLLPSFSVGGGIAKLAGKAAGKWAAIGTGGAQASADAGSDAYEQLLSTPEEIWQLNPDYLHQLNQGRDPQEIKNEIALNLSRNTAIATGITSIGLSKLPGADYLEGAFAGIRLPGSRLRSALAGAGGEAAQEIGEEAGGQFYGNVATSRIDPNQDLSEGVGEAAGMAGLGGGLFGGVAGVATPRRPIEESVARVAEAPTVDDAIRVAQEELGMDLGFSDAMAKEAGEIKKGGYDLRDVNTILQEADAIERASSVPGTVPVQQQTSQEVVTPESSTIMGMDQNSAPAGEPPVPEGMTRLYHGSAERGRYDGPAWFSTNRQYAENYRPGAELQYVDVPTDQINAKADPDGYGQTPDRGFTYNVELDSSATGPRKPVNATLSDAQDNGEWRTFSPQTGSLGIPRADMPQVRAEARGALTQYLKGQGLEHTLEEVPANTLKPTQAEYSPAKVRQAMDYEGGDRSIIVSSDGYIIDGHHQFLAKNPNDPIKIIRINAPISEVLDVVRGFPSAEQAQDTGQVATESENILSQLDQESRNKSAEAAPVIATESVSNITDTERAFLPQPEVTEEPVETITDADYRSPTQVLQFPQKAAAAPETAKPTTIPEILDNYAAQSRTIDNLRSFATGYFGRAAAREMTAEIQAAWERKTGQVAQPAPEVVRSDTSANVPIEPSAIDRARQQQAEAAADEDVGSFTLAGSNAPADQAAARGQTSIFDAPQASAEPKRMPASASLRVLADSKDTPYALDLQKNRTGWKIISDQNSDAVVLVSEDGKQAVKFTNPNPSSGTEAKRIYARASAYAIDNPYEVEQKELPKGELEIKPLFQKPQEQPKDGGAAIRAAFNALPSVTIGSWHPLTVTFNGVTQHFLANQKQAARAGKNLPAIHLVNLRSGRQVANLPREAMAYYYKLDRNNELVEEGIPGPATERQLGMWEKAGFPDPKPQQEEKQNVKTETSGEKSEQVPRGTPLSDISITETYDVEGTGQKAVVTRTAQEMLDEVDANIDATKRLIACLKGG